MNQKHLPLATETQILMHFFVTPECNSAILKYGAQEMLL